MLRRGRSNGALETGLIAEIYAPEKPRSPGSRDFRRRSRNRRAWLIVLACLAALILYALWSLEAELTLLYFKWRDHSFSRPASSCRLRKPPLVYVRGDHNATVVWETTCVRPGMQLIYRALPQLAAVEHLTVPNDSMETHHIHRAALNDLGRGERVSYSIVDTDTNSMWAKGSFVWLPRSDVRMGFVADNQYNVRTFRRVLQRMRRFYHHAAPNLLVHAGDAVQNAYDLAMWQTDFSDPLHNAIAFGEQGVPPLLWTPGNHDHDRTGSHPYTGGSPTFRALSIGPSRWIVLDSNDNRTAQVEFLRQELDSHNWKEASLRIILVHISPFVEYWKARVWAPPNPDQLELKAGSWRPPKAEREWGRHIRDHLAPMWHSAARPAHLILSGHSHAYTRGFLAHSAAPALLALHNSSSEEASAAVHAARERHPSAPGTVYTTAGGAGGTLDYDRVEDWGFFESTVTGKHHWVDLHLESGKATGGSETYTMEGDAGCSVADRLTWTARDVGGEVIDTFSIAGCRSSQTV